MDYVRETHDVPMSDEIISFAGNLSSPIPPPIIDDIPEDQLIIIEEPDEMNVQHNIIPNNPDVDETFEEFANYVLTNCDYYPRNTCIVCGIDMGEDNPRQYCEKTYCPEM